MKAPDQWTWSKYVETPEGLRGSRREVSAASRLTADRIAEFYGRVIPEYATGVLLDLGCGKAPLYGLYRRYTDDAICVDWANSIHANPHLDFLQDLNEPLVTIDSESVSTVILSDTLEHIRRPRDLMNEIGRVLTPGGHLLMNVPFMYWLHEVPHDYYRYTRYGLEYLIDDAGMRLIEVEAIGGAPEVLGDVASKAVARVPKVGRAIASGIQAATAAVVRRGPGARVSQRSRELFPLGYVLVAAKARSSAEA